VIHSGTKQVTGIMSESMNHSLNQFTTDSFWKLMILLWPGLEICHLQSENKVIVYKINS